MTHASFSFLLVAFAGLAFKANRRTEAFANPDEIRLKERIAVYQIPQQPGSLTVQSGSKKAVAFYLFDVEGKLVYQSRLQTGEPQTIEGLAAGTYTYQAFRADVQLKGGRVEIRD